MLICPFGISELLVKNLGNIQCGVKYSHFFELENIFFLQSSEKKKDRQRGQNFSGDGIQREGSGKRVHVAFLRTSSNRT